MSTAAAAATSTNLPSVRQTFLTRTKAFKRLTRWAFEICDANSTGRVGKSELYAGIILVHLTLAKYAGPAACYPPSRDVVDQLFEASDDDKSGDIDETEFQQIVVICCAQITSRILVYYALIIFAVPHLAATIIDSVIALDDFMGWGVRQRHAELIPGASWLEKVLTWGQIAEQMVSLTLFFLVVPLFFNWIDLSSRQAAAAHVVSSSPSTTTTTPSVLSVVAGSTSNQEKKEE